MSTTTTRSISCCCVGGVWIKGDQMKVGPLLLLLLLLLSLVTTKAVWISGSGGKG